MELGDFLTMKYEFTIQPERDFCSANNEYGSKKALIKTGFGHNKS